MKKLNPLTAEETNVIVYKGTEAPFTGEYDDFFVEGTYHCRRCNAPLYVSDSKFHSGCGWPSFDQEIEGAVKRVTDQDGSRTEIICINCDAHLGHVFEGENLTPKNTRHCVNSISLKFIPKMSTKLETAIFGGGCFWCTEAVFLRLKGVNSVTSGYAGGTVENPTYEQVSDEQTGHAEVIRIEFDPSIISYEQLLAVFWAVHDPTSLNQQGADRGTQYRSIILYTNESQKEISETSKSELESTGAFSKNVVTEIKKLDKFYDAESYHREYYDKHEDAPYCQIIISPKLKKLEEKFSALMR